MCSSSDGYPFDGSCELSKDADFTLTFDDGSSLKVPKSVLELASPVFKIAIQECEHDGILNLPETSKDTWTLILNRVHPDGRPNSRIEKATTGYPDIMIDLLTQCRKYDFVSLHKAVDEAIANSIATYFSSCDRRWNSYRYRFIRAAYCPNLFKAISRFDLPKTENALASYMIRLLTENEEILMNRIDKGMKKNERWLLYATRSVRDIINQMDNDECYRLCSSFARKVMANEFCLTLDYLKHKTV